MDIISSFQKRCFKSVLTLLFDNCLATEAKGNFKARGDTDGNAEAEMEFSISNQDNPDAGVTHELDLRGKIEIDSKGNMKGTAEVEYEIVF